MKTVMMECGLLRGRVHNKWPIQNHNMLKESILIMEHKGRDCLEPSFYGTSRVGKLCRVFKASSSSEDQLRCLDSYFRKLHNDDLHSSSRSFNKGTGVVDPSIQLKAKKELKFLEDYLSKVDEGNF